MWLAFLLITGQLGSEIVVNDDTCGGTLQQFPAVAVDDSGCFYCVWNDFRAGDFESETYLQRFDRNGVRLGVNLKLTTDQPSRDIWRYSKGRTDIALTKTGVFVATQDRRRGAFDIYGQLFDRQLNRTSPLIRVNDDWNGANHDFPRVVAAGNNTVVIWEDWREGNRTLYGQVFDSSLQALAPNFRVCVAVAADQYHPAVAGCRDGFTVVWAELVGDSTHICARRFSTDGQPQGDDFSVFPEQMVNPFCTMDESGYLWAGAEETDSARDILVSLFAPNGNPVGSPRVVNESHAAPGLRYPSASTLTDRGRTLVTWIGIQSGVRVYGQFLDSMGNSIGNNFAISGFSQGQATTACALFSSDCYFVAWKDSQDNNQDIYCFHSARGESIVNDDGHSAMQDFPCVAIDSAGNSFVVWVDYRNSYACPDIYGQRYDNRAQPVGVNERINDTGRYNRQTPWVATDREGKSVVVWGDTRRGGNASVYCQLFDESGNRVGGNLCVSDSGPNATWPIVVMDDSSGRFLITWASASGLYCRQYRWPGEPVSPPDRVAGGSDWIFPALNPDGTFWLSWVIGGHVCLQKFDTLYQPLTQPLAASETTCGSLVFLRRDAGGVIWAAWMDWRTATQYELFGRRCGPDGTFLCGEFQINDDNVGCQHLFPVWATDGERMYVTFTDFRIEGDLNVMAQVYDLSGRALGGNFIVNSGAPPFADQWAWGSVAACRDYVAYIWIDNRNLRSWDTYFKLDSTTNGLLEPEGYEGKIRVHSWIARASTPFVLHLSQEPGPLQVRVFDRAGHLVRSLADSKARGQQSFSCQGFSSGIYFAVVQIGSRRDYYKLAIIE